VPSPPRRTGGESEDLSNRVSTCTSSSCTPVNDPGLEPDYCPEQIRPKFIAKINIISSINKQIALFFDNTMFKYFKIDKAKAYSKLDDSFINSYYENIPSKLSEFISVEAGINKGKILLLCGIRIFPSIICYLALHCIHHKIYKEHLILPLSGYSQI